MTWLIRHGRKISWLVGGKKNTRAHIWTEDDTVCRMWSTGGLKRESYEVQDDRGNHKICHMCELLAVRAATMGFDRIREG